MQEEHPEKIKGKGSEIKNNEIIENIKYHIENKMYITIERIFEEELNTISGFPLIITDKYLLMTVIVDFHDEGYSLLMIEDISDAYSKENDNFYEKICINEGLQKKEIPTFLHDLSDIKQILVDLQHYDGFIAIQCEKQNINYTFCLGKIQTVKENCVIFKDVDMNGKWDESLDEILFDNITQITFDDNYSKTYYKYVK